MDRQRAALASWDALVDLADHLHDCRALTEALTSGDARAVRT